VVKDLRSLELATEGRHPVIGLCEKNENPCKNCLLKPFENLVKDIMKDVEDKIMDSIGRGREPDVDAIKLELMAKYEKVGAKKVENCVACLEKVENCVPKVFLKKIESSFEKEAEEHGPRLIEKFQRGTLDVEAEGSRWVEGKCCDSFKKLFLLSLCYIPFVVFKQCQCCNKKKSSVNVVGKKKTSSEEENNMEKYILTTTGFCCCQCCPCRDQYAEWAYNKKSSSSSKDKKSSCCDIYATIWAGIFRSIILAPCVLTHFLVVLFAPSWMYKYFVIGCTSSCLTFIGTAHLFGRFFQGERYTGDCCAYVFCSCCGGCACF